MHAWWPGVLLQVFLAAPGAQSVEWVRGGTDGKQPVWGIRDGLHFALPPAAGHRYEVTSDSPYARDPTAGPRGLIRILYPTLPGGKFDLINFIAVEPIVRGERGFSELERSKLDDKPGKRFWVEPARMQGSISRLDGSVEKLQVVVQVERFENGAHVKLLLEQRSDRPGELAITVHAEQDSAPMEYCILTATMGNRARARNLWLRDETVSSLRLYADYRGSGFAPHTTYPLHRLTLTEEGDLLVAITTDERRPADVRPFPGRDRWYYGGFPVTQLWRKPKGSWRNDLHAAVNARHTYWRSDRPIPGGVSFENFELRERFHSGQQFVFGVTRQTPAELGLTE